MMTQQQDWIIFNKTTRNLVQGKFQRIFVSLERNIRIFFVSESEDTQMM